MAAVNSAAATTAASSVAARLTTFTPTVVATAGQAVTLTAAATAAASSAAAQSILDKGAHPPNQFEPGNPLKLWIIQVVIIIALSRGLGYILRKIRQPAVISEVIGGLILGPSVMGRVPGFTKNIFPPASIPSLTLVANIGLVIFLFLVGLEADLSVFKKNGKAALGISFFGLAVPFGLGAAVSVGIYKNFVSDTVDFGIFLLFIGTAMAITAFPVLARILSELKLLSNPVGLTVLAAGVGNDIVGWILLALSVALANAGSGVTTVYILLTAAGLGLFLWFLVKPVFHFMVRRSGSYEHGPTAGIMVLTFIVLFATAWVTDVIGIHAIFGSFLVGLIVVPHHHGFATAITEKMEDLVTILFIPIYFALSGLKTDLGLLNSGSIWGWVVCVCVVAFASKFIACAGTAKVFGFPVRESLAIGTLMSCKGLVELIVLNIGLQAGILNNEVFAIFVVMALVTTFITTPLTIAVYPEHYWRGKMAAALEAEKNEKKAIGDAAAASSKEGTHFRKRFLVVLERFESLPSMMSFVRLLQPSSSQAASSATSVDGKRMSIDEKGEHEAGSSKAGSSVGTPPALGYKASASSSTSVTVDVFRLLALTERTSALLKASEAEITKRGDSLLKIFSAFVRLASIPFTTSMAIVPEEEYVQNVTGHAASTGADLLVIPWTAGTSLNAEDDVNTGNRLESLFGQQAIERSPQYAAFVRDVFLESASDVGLYLDAGHSEITSEVGNVRHIFLPFQGGPDDRAALDFLVQLVANDPHISGTVIRYSKIGHAGEPSSDSKAGEEEEPSTPITAGFSSSTGPGGRGIGRHDTIYPGATTQHKLDSDTADNLALARYFRAAMMEETNEEGRAVPTHVSNRVSYEAVDTRTPLVDSLTALQALRARHHSVLVITGRSRRFAPTHKAELAQYLKEKAVVGSGVSSLGIAGSSDVRKTLGDIGSALVVSGDADSILIIQTAVKGSAYVRKTRRSITSFV